MLDSNESYKQLSEGNASQFVDDLIRYIVESVEEDDDDLSVEFVCRKLRKYNLIDVDGDRYILTYRGKDEERNIKWFGILFQSGSLCN